TAIKALAIGNKIATLQLKISRLKDKLKQGACTPAKTTIKLVFENNSKYNVTIYIDDSDGVSSKIGTVPAVKIGTIQMSISQIQNYVGTNAQTVNLQFFTIINNKEVIVSAFFSMAKLPTKKPCTGTAKWEMFDSTFPVPASNVYVFGVDAGPNIYIGEEDKLKNRSKGSFANGGLSSDKVTYGKLSSSFSTLPSAQKAFCGMVQEKIYYNSPNCSKRFKINGKWYFGCESSVQSAVSNYCPQYK
ncbi:hypothetical protein OAO01_09655, partial [Oligoflexia bacterium]|nr:hypothetical protein [Oligoflexia bacterium]